MMAIGWKSGVVEKFIATCGVSLQGEQHVSEQFDGRQFKSVNTPQPIVLQQFHEVFGKIDLHDRLRQGVLRFEKVWKTTNGFFRMHTTLIGMIVTDSFLTTRTLQPEFDFDIVEFTRKLAADLVRSGKTIANPLPSRTPAGVTQCALVKFPRKSGKKGGFQKQLACQWCSRQDGNPGIKTSWYCRSCDVALCSPTINDGRQCFAKHIQSGLPTTKRRRCPT